MFRAVLLALVLVGCHHDDPPPMHPKEGELPPLPPSSGTPVGYLLDNASQLQLRDDQLKQLKEIDQSLSARDAEIDTQLRIIEKPQEDPEVAKGAPPPRHNNAPGAGPPRGAPPPNPPSHPRQLDRRRRSRPLPRKACSHRRRLPTPR